MAWVMGPGRWLAWMSSVCRKFSFSRSKKTRKSSLPCPTLHCSCCKCLLSLQVSTWGQVTESQWKSGHPQQQKLTCRSGRQVYISESINLSGTIKLDLTKWTGTPNNKSNQQHLFQHCKFLRYYRCHPTVRAFASHMWTKLRHHKINLNGMLTFT